MAEQADLGQQGRDCGIDPEDAGSKAEGHKALRLKQFYFKVNPAPFRADGKDRPLGRLSQQPFGCLGNGSVAFRMGEKPGRAISQQLGQQVFHKRPEAWMDGDFRQPGVHGLFKPKAQRFRKVVVLDEGGAEKAFFHPVGVDQEDSVHPKGGRLRQDPFEHDRTGYGQNQVGGWKGWRFGGKMHCKHNAVVVHFLDAAGAEHAVKHADPHAVSNCAAEDLADMFGAASGQGGMLIGQFLRME